MVVKRERRQVLEEIPDIHGLEVLRRDAVKAEIQVTVDASEASFLRLLSWLPRRHEVSFYDQYFPSTPADPGGYVSVQRKVDRFAYMIGNHGWMVPWQSQSARLLAAWMALSLTSKPAPREPARRLEVRADAALPPSFETR